jgi:hypothetical protein
MITWQKIGRIAERTALYMFKELLMYLGFAIAIAIIFIAFVSVCALGIHIGTTLFPQ